MAWGPQMLAKVSIVGRRSSVLQKGAGVLDDSVIVCSLGEATLGPAD